VPVPGEMLIDRLTDLEQALLDRMKHHEGTERWHPMYIEFRNMIERRRAMEVAANAC
jgi:hypothetical protein